MGRTEPKNLAIEADIFWMREAKQNPLTWFEVSGTVSHASRKGHGAPPKNQMVDVGKGVIDWRANFLAVEEGGSAPCFRRA